MALSPYLLDLCVQAENVLGPHPAYKNHRAIQADCDWRRNRVPRMTDATAANSRLDQIKAGYAFDGPALDFGAAVTDGTAHPEDRKSTRLNSSHSS